jgi:hypothetical protein
MILKNHMFNTHISKIFKSINYFFKETFQVVQTFKSRWKKMRYLIFFHLKIIGTLKCTYMFSTFTYIIIIIYQTSNVKVGLNIILINRFQTLFWI